MNTEILITIVVAIFGSTGFWTWLLSRDKKKSAEGKLLLGLAYAEIIRRCELYIERGYIGADEYNELHRYLYEPYKELGGDGTAEKMMAAVKALPTEVIKHA